MYHLCKIIVKICIRILIWLQVCWFVGLLDIKSAVIICILVVTAQNQECHHQTCLLTGNLCCKSYQHFMLSKVWVIYYIYTRISGPVGPPAVGIMDGRMYTSLYKYRLTVSFSFCFFPRVKEQWGSMMEKMVDQVILKIC